LKGMIMQIQLKLIKLGWHQTSSINKLINI